MRTTAPALAMALLLAAAAVAQVQPPSYPEGAAVPRSLAPVEAAWIAAHPLAATDVVTPPPTGPVHCAAEYEPMQALLMAWEGLSSWKAILAAMAAPVTTIGNADVVMVVDAASEIPAAQAALTASGTNMSRVSFVVRPTDSIWIRDYGPRFIYQGGCRAVVDHTYNRPRPLDNAFNGYFAAARGHALYELPLVHGGGNFHLDALGRSRATRLVVNENPSLTESQIHAVWQSYQNVDTAFYDPFPTSVDGTQHIDMWMQVIGDDAVVISDWPFDSGSIQDQICDDAALSMAAEGYTVHRVPARNVGGVHYTYTNVVMCNDLVLVPTYTNGAVSPMNATALSVWQAAVPGRTVVAIGCEGIVSAAGVMHCIVMHVPVPLGGAVPTAYLVNLNGGEVLTPGAVQEIRWITDDDVAVTSVDLLLSTDGGSSFPTVIAGSIADTGSYFWTVPALCAGQAKIRVVARDAVGQIGHDDSDAAFVIDGAGCTAAAIPYGAGKPGQLGLPLLGATPPVFGSSFTLSLSNAWPGATVFLLLGPSPAALPFDGGTILVAFTEPLSFALGPTGSFTLSATVPTVPALAGTSFYWQVWIANDPGASGLGFAATQGLETRLGF